MAVPPKNVRPTSSMVKEAIFSVLNSALIKLDLVLSDLKCMDLFAGSGALGIEALSRGARHVTFVDNNPDSLAAIKQNIKSLSLESRSTVIRGDAVGATKQIVETVDLILCDPPYEWINYADLVGGNYFHLGVFESGHDISDLVKDSELRVLKLKKYGTTYLTVVQRVP